jgi:hypothetical protein
MPRVIFKGRVHPEAYGLRVWNLPTIHFKEPSSQYLPQGLQITYDIKVHNANMVLDCEVEPWSPDLYSWVHGRVALVASAVVDLYSFASGTPLVVHIDSYIEPDGTEKRVIWTNPHLEGICTVMKRNSEGMNLNMPVLETFFQEPNLALAMRDLISGATVANSTVTDCARAIEGIRHILSPNVNKRGEGWGKLQDVLNIDRSYREVITSASANPRHGDKTYIPGNVVEDVTVRSWTIMNRFLEYMVRGKKKLPLSEFPLLK